MIDFSFHFTEATEEEKQILDSDIKSQAPSNSYIRYFTGRRWNNCGVAAVDVRGNVCTILKVKMQNDISTEFSDVYFFYEYLIYYIFNFAKRVEWKKVEPNFQEDFLKVIAYFDRKVVGEGRVRTVYKADVIKDSDDIIYYVEQQKKVFIKRLNKPKKEKPEPLMLSRSETGLPVDISDVEAWSTAEWGQMEYIVLSKGDETYCIFPENKDQQTDEKHEMERIWNFFGDDYEDTCFTKEEIEAVREWMKVQLKDENSTLSRYFAQRRAEDEKHHKELFSRIQKNTARQKENLIQLKAKL